MRYRGLPNQGCVIREVERTPSTCTGGSKVCSDYFRMCTCDGKAFFSFFLQVRRIERSCALTGILNLKISYYGPENPKSKQYVTMRINCITGIHDYELLDFIARFFFFGKSGKLKGSVHSLEFWSSKFPITGQSTPSLSNM